MSVREKVGTRCKCGHISRTHEYGPCRLCACQQFTDQHATSLDVLTKLTWHIEYRTMMQNYRQKRVRFADGDYLCKSMYVIRHLPASGYWLFFVERSQQPVSLGEPFRYLKDAKEAALEHAIKRGTVVREQVAS